VNVMIKGPERRPMSATPIDHVNDLLILRDWGLDKIMEWAILRAEVRGCRQQVRLADRPYNGLLVIQDVR